MIDGGAGGLGNQRPAARYFAHQFEAAEGIGQRIGLLTRLDDAVLVVVKDAVTVVVLEHLGIFDVSIDQPSFEARRIGARKVHVVKVKIGHSATGATSDKQHLDDLTQIHQIKLSQVDVDAVPAGHTGQLHAAFQWASGAIFRHQLECEGAGRFQPKVDVKVALGRHIEHARNGDVAVTQCRDLNPLVIEIQDALDVIAIDGIGIRQRARLAPIGIPVTDRHIGVLVAEHRNHIRGCGRRHRRSRGRRRNFDGRRCTGRRPTTTAAGSQPQASCGTKQARHAA